MFPAIIVKRFEPETRCYTTVQSWTIELACLRSRGRILYKLKKSKQKHTALPVIKKKNRPKRQNNAPTVDKDLLSNSRVRATHARMHTQAHMHSRLHTHTRAHAPTHYLGSNEKTEQLYNFATESSKEKSLLILKQNQKNKVNNEAELIMSRQLYSHNSLYLFIYLFILC